MQPRFGFWRREEVAKGSFPTQKKRSQSSIGDFFSKEIARARTADNSPTTKTARGAKLARATKKPISNEDESSDEGSSSEDEPPSKKTARTARAAKKP